MEAIRKTRPSKTTEESSYELTEIEASISGPTQFFNRFSEYMLELLVQYFYRNPGCINEWFSDSCACS